MDEPSDYRLMSASLSMDEHEEKIDIEKDTDEDGLSDLYELANDLDLDNPDTDGDGLSDGFEVLYASSNPLSIYTLENGVPDSELDPDGDGLDLLTEYEHGSDPLSQDSDWDGLKDNEEVLEYHTDPASADSDNDGVPDGEEIKCGLDPLNTSTYGYQDYDYAHSTVLGVDFDTKSVVANNDVYDLGIELLGHGNSGYRFCGKS